jgi:hypothetical protein
MHSEMGASFTTFDPRLRDLFLNKPEGVINLPEWSLSADRIQAYQSMTRPAIVEIAGRDSIAAAVIGVEAQGFTDLLPTYVYTGTEYGAWERVEKAVERLLKRLPQVRVHDLLLLGSPGFWQALNGRFIAELVSRYGFYTPCVGCHLYLHSVRIPLATMLGNVPILAGERERHDQAIKVNQISEALDIYQDMVGHFGITLLLPLRHTAEGTRIRDTLGLEWPAGEDQLGCVLAGNYRGWNQIAQNSARQVQRYLEEFARPCSEKIVASYLKGEVPNHLEIGARVLESLK